MRPGAPAPAAAATGLLSGPASASAAGSGSGSGCPRVTDGAVRRKEPIVELSTNDLTASIERSTGEVRERVSQERARYLHRLRLTGGNLGRCARMHFAVATCLGAAEANTEQ